METTAREDADADLLAGAVLCCTLPKGAWDHEAHLTFAYATVRAHGVGPALPVIRKAIHRYNEATGTPNTDHSGYHETLTAYYCRAVGHLMAGGHGLGDVLAHDLTARSAPLAFWERDELMATPARLRWLAPSRPLPFAPDDGGTS